MSFSLVVLLLLLLQVPEDMQDKEFAAILQDEPMQPLALVPLTEEEQVCHKHNPKYANTC